MSDTGANVTYDSDDFDTETIGYKSPIIDSRLLFNTYKTCGEILKLRDECYGEIDLLHASIIENCARLGNRETTPLTLNSRFECKFGSRVRNSSKSFRNEHKRQILRTLAYRNYLVNLDRVYKTRLSAKVARLSTGVTSSVPAERSSVRLGLSPSKAISEGTKEAMSWNNFKDAVIVMFCVDPKLTGSSKIRLSCSRNSSRFEKDRILATIFEICRSADLSPAELDSVVLECVSPDRKTQHCPCGLEIVDTARKVHDTCLYTKFLVRSGAFTVHHNTLYPSTTLSWDRLYEDELARSTIAKQLSGSSSDE